MKKRESRWSVSLFMLFCAGCLGAQLVQVPQKSEYAPKNYIQPAAMVRYPIAPMTGTRRDPVTPDYQVKHREKAFQAMFESCEGPNYSIVREEEIVVEGEAVWKQVHFRCDDTGADGGVSASSPDGGV